MSIDFNTDQIIIVDFPGFGGGKFIMSCLSLSKHATPQNTKIADYLLNNPEDYEYRLNAVMSTLPPPEEMTKWRERWEFGDTEFYGGDVLTSLKNWKHGPHHMTPVNQRLYNLISKQMCFFITSHGGTGMVEKIVDVWPNARIVSLINSEKFWNIAVRLKQDKVQDPKFASYAGNMCQDKYQLLKGPDWPDWDLFEKCNYDVDKVLSCVTIRLDIQLEMKQFYHWYKIKNKKFMLDVDNNYFDKDCFLQTMRDLYTWMNFDDFNSDLVERFYQQYMSLHA
jgi:hypothetical protein